MSTTPTRLGRRPDLDRLQPCYVSLMNPEHLAEFVERLESPDRAEWQKPDEVVALLGLTPGQVACEIGAGTGYFALRMAEHVGNAGTVFAVDVEPAILALLGDRLRERGLANVVPVLGREDEPLVPAASCDLVLMVDVFHHVAEPVTFLRRLRRLLRHGGRIVNIDYDMRPCPVGPPPEMRIDRERFLALAAEAGLRHVAEHRILPWQYFIELKPEADRY